MSNSSGFGNIIILLSFSFQNSLAVADSLTILYIVEF